MGKIKEYYIQSKTELDKVVFPTKGQTKNAYITVFIVVAVISLFLALVDLMMSFFVSSVV